MKLSVSAAFDFYFQSAGASALHSSPSEKKRVSAGLGMYEQLVYVTKSAQELLFDGYQDDLIDIAIEFSRTDKTVPTPPYDRFGWFYTVSNVLLRQYYHPFTIV